MEQLHTMYQPKKDSPTTYLVGDIGTSDTYIMVGSSELITQAVPFPLTLGIDKSVTETVIVTDLGNGNNQLTVTRGPNPLSWIAGTKCARVLTANDITSIQQNIHILETQVDENITNIVNNHSELSNLIADEILRATQVEQVLTNSKINREELTTVITDVNYIGDGTSVSITFTTYDANAQSNGQFIRTLPMVTNSTVGVLSPEDYVAINQLRTDVSALQLQGGRFIGESFATYTDLLAYEIPSSVNIGDFTYVLDDEGHLDATTRYIYNGIAFEFAYVINHDPVGIANATTPGLVLSDPGDGIGNIFININGTMRVIGWQELVNDVANIISANNPVVTFQLNGTDVDHITLNQNENQTINFNINDEFAKLQADIDRLVNEHKAYHMLEDSNGDSISDSDDNMIQGQYIFVIK